MSEDTPWLSQQQQRTWRSWLAINTGLPAALNKQLQEDSGLSLPDFDVLVQLAETPGAKLRVVALARTLGWERSRLSHHVKRMEGRGLVDREGCSDDGRGAFIALTDAGRDALETAAPGHVWAVRGLVFDSLSAEGLDLLEQFTTTVQARLAGTRA